MALFIRSFFGSLLRFTIYARMLQPPQIGIGATWLKPLRAEV